MSVNLYDSPAQAKFINTYVPIQFEGLYRIADKAQKNLDDINALQDEVITNYSTVNTLSRPDRETWNEKYSQVKQWVDENITDAESLKDPIKQAGYKSVVRKMKGDPIMSTILINAQIGREYTKNSDPRWGDMEVDRFRNWSSRDGIFQDRNLPYMDRQQILHPMLSQLKPEIVGKKDKYYDFYGVSHKRAEGVIDENAKQLLGNPVYRQLAESELKSMGRPYDENSLMNYMISTAKGFAGNYAWMDQKINEGRMFDIKEANENARARAALAAKRAAEQQITSRNAQLRGKIVDDSANNKLNYSLRQAQEAYEIMNRRPQAGGVFSPKAKMPIGGRDALEYYKDVNILNQFKKELSNPNTSKERREKINVLTKRLIPRMQQREEAILAAYQIEEEKMSRGEKSLISRETLSKLAVTKIDPIDVDNWYKSTYESEPEKVDLGGVAPVKVWTPKTTNQFKVTSLNGMLLRDASSSPSVAAVNKLFASNRFSSAIGHEPTDEVSPITGDKVMNKGFAYIPEDIFKEYYKGDMNEIDDDFERITVKPSKNEFKYYVKVPVATAITEDNFSGSSTAAIFDDMYNKAGVYKNFETFHTQVPK